MNAAWLTVVADAASGHVSVWSNAADRLGNVIQDASVKLGVEYHTLLVLAALTALGACSGVVGGFAVLRRRALTGDALAHAALPGLCVAFLLAGERSVPWMLLGAFASGLLGILTIVALRRWTRVKEDAAIGIVLSVFFGAGIALSGWVQNQSDVGNKAGLDSFILGRTSGLQATDLLLLLLATGGCTALVTLAFKEFRLIAFDSPFAASQGWPVGAIDFALLGMVAIVVVVGLPTVGVALMAALLIIPGAAARFWTERLGTMTVLGGLFGAAIGLAGGAASAYFERLPTGPIVVLSGTVLFVASALLAPKRGAAARWFSELEFARRLTLESILASLAEADATNRTVTQPATAPPRGWYAALREARKLGLVESSASVGDASPRLTPLGRERAIARLRNERIWRIALMEYPALVIGVANPLRDNAVDVLPEDVLRAIELELRTAGRWPDANDLLGRETQP